MMKKSEEQHFVGNWIGTRNMKVRIKHHMHLRTKILLPIFQ